MVDGGFSSRQMDLLHETLCDTTSRMIVITTPYYCSLVPSLSASLSPYPHVLVGATVSGRRRASCVSR
eukprot:3289597-Pleurochrysis_carterae.AAC.1